MESRFPEEWYEPDFWDPELLLERRQVPSRGQSPRTENLDELPIEGAAWLKGISVQEEESERRLRTLPVEIEAWTRDVSIQDVKRSRRTGNRPTQVRPQAETPSLRSSSSIGAKDDYLTTAEAAKEVRVHQKTIERACRNGNLRSSKAGNRWRITRTALRKWLDEGRPKY